MTRINALRSIAGTRHSIVWGKNIATAALGDLNALVFAALLIVCSVAVGCSSEKPQPISSNNQIPVTQPQVQSQSMPAPVMQAEIKPTPKKVVHKKPATVNYSDKTYGVTFEYPRRYAIETGNAATEVVASNPLPMNFVQPGGVALAAVELPETGFANTDFSSAFFNVSVNKTLTPDQCGEFAVPEPKMTKTEQPDPAVALNDAGPKQDPSVPATDSTSAQPAATPSDGKLTPSSDSASKRLIGEMELQSTEAVTGEGTRQSDSKYFHTYQNGACYEFVVNVTTDASADGFSKHVNRDRVFDRLEKILATVKINPVAAPEVTADNPTPSLPAPTAQE